MKWPSVVVQTGPGSDKTRGIEVRCVGSIPGFKSMLILNHPRSLSVKVDTSGFCLFVTRVQEFSVSEITLKRVFSGHQYLGVRIFLFIISRQKQNIHGGYTTISICTSRHLLDQRTVKLPMIITNTQNYGVLAQRFAIESLAKSEIECDHT